MHSGSFPEPIEPYSSLLQKYFEGRLSADERKLLARWLWKDRKNRLLLRKLKEGKALKVYYDERQRLDAEYEYKLLIKRYPQMKEGRWKLTVVMRWAAAVVIVLSITLSLWTLKKTEGTIGNIEEEKGKIVAILKTPAGKIISLNGEGREQTTGCVEGVEIRDSLKELVCRQIPECDSLAMHKLSIPRGGEYKLILCDGTRVWLNSESEIHFPVAFAKTERVVRVKGEVYLEVAREEKRPFRVETETGNVEVLGTSFGMSVYPKEQRWSTILVQGSVQVKVGEQKLVLKPGRQAMYQEGQLEEREGDVEKELDWVQGLFVFKHDRLEEVARKLSRWYNVEFRFTQEKLKDYLFTGQVSRDVGVKYIIELMKRMNVVEFEQQDGVILIKEKAGIY